MTNEGEVLLQELLNTEFESESKAARGSGQPMVAGPLEEAEPVKGKGSNNETHSQWALGGNGKFMPVGATVPTLPPGVYETFASPGMWGLEKSNIVTDGIYALPDMATEMVMDEVNKFWESESRYREHNLLYKRGIMLWGPPGGGKTVAVKLLMQDLVKRDGIVIIGQSIALLVLCLKAVRRIEPKRNLIVVLEDIDEIINYNGESIVLSMLDGENNVDNILHLATTNYPERLGGRIINRPSRFDRRVYVGMPSSAARKSYLTQATKKGLTAKELKQWLVDTEGMSIAHLRELVAAVYCLNQPYPEVISRLQDMSKQVKAADEFNRSKLGFTSNATKGSLSE